MANVTITETRDKELRTIITVRFEEEGWNLNYEPTGVCLRCDGFPAIPETISTRTHAGAFMEWIPSIIEVYEVEGWHKAIATIRNAKAEGIRI